MQAEIYSREQQPGHVPKQKSENRKRKTAFGFAEISANPEAELYLKS